MKIEDFASREPRFVVEDYFLGNTRGWGIFEDRFGKLRREFTVDTSGRMEDGLLMIDEQIRYSDGESESRNWRIRRLPDGSYEGVADGVIGTARIFAAGNALNWRYSLDLKVGDSTWRVKFDDWMFLQPDGVVINRAYVTRWGFHIGSATITFRKD